MGSLCQPNRYHLHAHSILWNNGSDGKNLREGRWDQLSSCIFRAIQTCIEDGRKQSTCTFRTTSHSIHQGQRKGKWRGGKLEHDSKTRKDPEQATSSSIMLWFFIWAHLVDISRFNRKRVIPTPANCNFIQCSKEMQWPWKFGMNGYDLRTSDTRQSSIYGKDWWHSNTLYSSIWGWTSTSFNTNSYATTWGHELPCSNTKGI